MPFFFFFAASPPFFFFVILSIFSVKFSLAVPSVYPDSPFSPFFPCFPVAPSSSSAALSPLSSEFSPLLFCGSLTGLSSSSPEKSES